MNNKMKEVYRNLWKEHKDHPNLGSRIETKNIAFTDLNGGVSPDVSMDLDFITLQADEYISEVIVHNVADFVDSGANNDLKVDVYDTTNSNSSMNTLIEMQGAGVPVSIGAVTNSFDGTSPYTTFMINSVQNIVLRFSATDLTLLTAGEWNISIEISSLK